MKWGEAAGFGWPELARNWAATLAASSPWPLRHSQRRTVLARRPPPLAGKKVVRLAACVRDLAQADWKPIPMRTRESAPEPAGNVVVVARLVTPVRPFPPDPHDAYPNALIALILQGPDSGEDRLDEPTCWPA